MRKTTAEEVRDILKGAEQKLREEGHENATIRPKSIWIDGVEHVFDDAGNLVPKQ